MLSLQRSRIVARTLPPTPLLRIRHQSSGPLPPRPPSLQDQQGPSSSTPAPPPTSGQSGSKHKLVYREIFPPLLRVLAYSSAVYFSLHLTWQVLDAREQRRLEEEVRREMEEQVRKEMEKKAEQGGASAGNGRSWWGWLTRK